MKTSRLLARLAAIALGGALFAEAVRQSRAGRQSAWRLQANSGTAAKPPPEQIVSGAHASGHRAAKPWQIPWRGWTAILKRTYVEFSADRVLAVAAGVTFYALLAIFPAIGAFVSLYGLVADRATLADHVNALEDVVPAGGIDIVSEQLQRLTQGDQVALGFGFLFGLCLALWSANAGIKAMFDALNIAYDEDEKRGFVRLNLISLTFTLGALLYVLVGVGAVAVVPLIFAWFGVAGWGPWILAALRWPLVLLVALLALSLLYRFGPSRSEARWEWITPGSLVAAFGWIAASIAFSWYASNFASYNETYGTLGGVIAFMTWMWLSAAIVLFGAELNAEAERQTARDTTTGLPRPRGMRGAAVADDLASA